MSKIKNLEKYQFFNGLKNSQLDKFDDIVKIKKYSQGEIIFKEGETGNSVFLLLSGEVEINQALTLQLNRGNYDTREKSIIHLSSEVCPCFGEMALVGDNQKRTATVQALSECEMARIMKEDFLNICETDPELGYTVMKNIGKIISDNLVNANQNVLKLTTAFSLILEK